MAFKKCYSQKAKDNQAADELAAWKMIVADCEGTPSFVEVDGISTKNNAGGITGWNEGNLNYEKWIETHKRYTKKARSERLRKKKEDTKGPVQEGLPVKPCQVDPELDTRETLRVAILEQSTTTGGTTLGKKKARTQTQLLAHMKDRLTRVDADLDRRKKHKEAHDLRINGYPPKRVFVAAEWFFRPPDRPYTSAEKNEIIEELKTISRTFPDWLLVSGTIYWSPTNPNDPNIPFLDVFNQAVVFAAGSVLYTRTKNDCHDITNTNRERWGRLHLDPAHLPVGITQASLDPPAVWDHNDLEWCLDICRDHYVGEAAGGYAQNLPLSPGSEVYIVVASEVLIADHFIAARDDGFFIICDGGSNNYNVYRIRRNDLNNVTTEIINYRANQATFVQQDSHQRALIKQYTDEKNILQNDAHYTSFIDRYKAVIASDSSNPVIKTALHTNHPLDDPASPFRDRVIHADRLKYLLDTYPAFATDQEEVIVRQFIQAERHRETASTARQNVGITNNNLKTTLLTASNVNKTGINALEAKVPKANDVKLYKLINLAPDAPAQE